MEAALAGLYRALALYLPGDVLIADRVYPDEVPAGVVRPYWVFFFVSGGESNDVHRQDAEFVLTVKCVAETLAQSLDGAGRISNKLNDAGRQDGAAAPIPGTSEWDILTVTQERTVHIVEKFEKAQPIYHDGNQYRFVMERK